MATVAITATSANFQEAAVAAYLGATSPVAAASTATTASHAAENSSASVKSAAIADDRRRWLWIFLAVLAASQLYLVKELVAAFALFALAFAAIAFLVIACYMLPKFWALGVARIAALRQPVLQVSPVTHDSKPA